MTSVVNKIDSGDAFVEELRQKKYDLGVEITGKKAEYNRLDIEQKRLGALIDIEKHANAGSSKQKKNKNHSQVKENRLDIVRNEQKHKEQARKLEEMKKEIHHLESELKSITHDLSVVEH